MTAILRERRGSIQSQKNKKRRTLEQETKERLMVVRERL
jgi:hypothetical protein